MLTEWQICCKTKQISCLFIMGFLFWCYVYVFKCGSRDVYVCHCDDSTVSYTFVAFHQKWTIDYHAIVDALASGVSIPFQILLDVLVSWTALMILCFFVSGFSTQLHMIIAHLAKWWLFVKWCRVSSLPCFMVTFFVSSLSVTICDPLFLPQTPSY